MGWGGLIGLLGENVNLGLLYGCDAYLGVHGRGSRQRMEKRSIIFHPRQYRFNVDKAQRQIVSKAGNAYRSPRRFVRSDGSVAEAMTLDRTRRGLNDELSGTMCRYTPSVQCASSLGAIRASDADVKAMMSSMSDVEKANCFCEMAYTCDNKWV